MSRILLAGILLPTIFVGEFFVGEVPGATEITQANYYVAPDGSDENPGNYQAPFQTLTRARDANARIHSRP